jgi:hypothetical protein
VRQTLLINELKNIQAKRSQLIPEIRKIEVKQKRTGSKQSEQNSSKAWQDRENYEVYLKSTVDTQHPEV